MKKKPFYARDNSGLLYPDWFLCHFCDQEVHHRDLWAILIRQPEPNLIRPKCQNCYEKEQSDAQSLQ